MKTIIIANGTPPSLELFKDELINSSTIICADGGANCLFEFCTQNNLQILPNYLIGDFDSISDDAFAYFKNQKIPFENHPKEKDATDTQLALKKAIDLGATEIVFLGCLGDRIDHAIGNFGILSNCINANIAACMKDDSCTVSLINKSTTIYGNKNAIFSLQAYSENVTNLSISGSKYELKNYNLQLGDGLTLSNEFHENEVKINFKQGKLLVIQIK